jgi:hypothetical protein
VIKPWFKKHFIPHEGNDHRPHFLHGKNARRMVLTILFVELALFVLPTLFILKNDDFLAAVLPGVLSELTNDRRKEASLNTLTSNPILDLAAQKKAEDMATKSYFAHTSPEGRTPWSWLSEAGYKFVYAGENLAVNFYDSEDVTDAWMDSPGHRANILKEGYTEVGTGVARGMYKGREAIFVAQFYGAPTPRVVAVLPTPVAPPTPTAPVSIQTPLTTPEPEPAPTNTNVPSDTVVLGEEIPSIPERTSPSFLEKTLSRPHHVTNIILIILASFVVVALLINIFVKINIQHPDLVTNGLMVVVVVFGLYLVNNQLTKSALSIGEDDLQSFESVSI